jgi:hypothetical protein
MISRRNIKRVIVDHFMLFVIVYAAIMIVGSIYTLIGVWR